MRCVIIDDEPLAVDVIESYLQHMDDMEIVAKCHNPIEAISILKKNKVDLVFLDIEMPNLTGIDLVNIVEHIPQFIFTTAYPQYALEGFELNATDYLIKPIAFQRFLKAVTRARSLHQKELQSEEISPKPVTPPSFNPFIFVRSEYENIKIETASIQYIQGLKDYIKIFTDTGDKPVLTLSSFKDIMEKLPEDQFLRVHRSYIINIRSIRALQKTKIVLYDGTRIPVGETFKDEVWERLGV
ncbi:DNA-binding response regulator [Robertkochia solimangrovi]|nr:DNA-binding response regulator [Robertkochia solimangrovi]